LQQAAGGSGPPAVVDHTLGRERRLRNSNDFQRVFDEPRHRVGGALFLLLACPNDLGHPRLGTVVSKAKAGNAVRRNRIRRVLKESFRTHQEQLAALDIVALLRRKTDKVLDTGPMHQELKRLWSRLAKIP